jgi:iron complex transport system substrate-binding protein
VPRVVSLIASATEIVCALGGESWLVGRSHECDYPASVQRLPVCTAPRFDTAGSSAEIDRRVKETLQNALSVYHVDADLLRELEPDVIVTQSHCEVCAVSLRDVERAVCSWLSACPKLVSLAPNGLADLWTGIEEVADALGVSERGTKLVARLRARMEALTVQAGAQTHRPTVACIEWIDPLMAAGNWVPELVDRAGGVNLFGEAGKHAPWLTWEQIVERAPDVIVLMPCGFDIARTRRDLPVLTEKPEWPRLKAVRTGRVFLTDGNQFFNRPGPRLAESLEILAELLHPAAFSFRHEGVGWERP